ncbi:hypothetical protein AOQ84DRAFT_375348 [Glonium stellatum]|uniref:Uncharacterized protein n=1 Tax=Glonium stellatum TaxID=574774 RepID=A0A8E2JUR3_9PEZI|nr:hypothetical protein AOQ84DRAFT_375348 [Glonium stellatum]
MPAIFVAQPSRSIAQSPASAIHETPLRGHLRFAVWKNTLTARADNSSGISGAQGTGIVFGVLGAVLLFVVSCFCCRKRRRKKASAQRASPEPVRRPRPSPRPKPRPKPPRKEKKEKKEKEKKKEKKQKKAPARRVRQAPVPAPVPQPAPPPPPPPPPPPQVERPTRPRPARVRDPRNAPPQPEPQRPQVVPQPPPPPALQPQPPPPPPPPEPIGPSVADRIRRFIPMSGPMMDFSRPPAQQQEESAREREISKQAQIFGAAAGSIAYLWTLEQLELLTGPLVGLGHLLRWALDFGDAKSHQKRFSSSNSKDAIGQGDIYIKRFETPRKYNWFSSLWALQEIVAAPAGVWMTRYGEFCRLNGEILTTRLMAMIIRLLSWAEK